MTNNPSTPDRDSGPGLRARQVARAGLRARELDDSQLAAKLRELAEQQRATSEQGREAYALLRAAADRIEAGQV